MYGGAERALGAALAGRRDEATVLTKIWTPSSEEARRQLADQLEWFGHVDVEQVHNLVAWETHLPWLEGECGGGRIGKLGVTHYSPVGVRASSSVRCGRGASTRVQVPLNPRERTCEESLLPLAAELGVAVIVMRPFGSGALARQCPRAGGAEPACRVRRHNLAAGAAEVGAVRRARRSGHPGNTAR